MKKLIRITTVPQSLKGLLKGQLRFMSNNGYEVIAVSSPGEALMDVTHNEGIRTLSLSMTRAITPYKDIKSLITMTRFFYREKPLIVHTHTPKAGTLGMLAAWLVRVPIRLHTVAGLPLMEAKGVKRRVLDLVEKLTYAAATKVYPNSHALKDFILDWEYTNEKKLKVIANGSSNGIDTKHFSPTHFDEASKESLRRELSIEAEDFVFVFVGRLVGDKGINELVRAFTKIENPRAKLLLVGPMEKELDPLLPATIQEIETNPRIISVGFQNDVRPYFAISNALAFPSYREGFPNVVMQAGAMGLPSIVTNINGCNEIIIDGENGRIVESKDADALFEAMQEFLDNAYLVEQMAERARPMICSRYEQRTVWEALLEEYKKIETGNYEIT